MAKYCSNCGSQINDKDRVCFNCGNHLEISSNKYENAEESTFGYAALGFVFPIVGLILYLVWQDERPRAARSAGKGALVSVISAVALYMLGFIIFLMLI